MISHSPSLIYSRADFVVLGFSYSLGGVNYSYINNIIITLCEDIVVTNVYLITINWHNMSALRYARMTSSPIRHYVRLTAAPQWTVATLSHLP